MDTFDKQSSIFAEILAKNKATDPVDIYPLVTLAALDVICGSWTISFIALVILLKNLFQSLLWEPQSMRRLIPTLNT